MAGTFLKFSFIVPNKGIRMFTAGVRNGKSRQTLYEKNEGKHRFRLYVRGEKLLIQIPKRGRLLKRFLRDFAKSSGGLPRTLSFWFTPFR